ncbi:MAG TPA: glycosyltransferase family 2 protein [Pirellulaceae bacterium]|nr:glycosyltransferase family 2 protein [Pirellulaceae bacterium]
MSGFTTPDHLSPADLRRVRDALFHLADDLPDAPPEIDRIELLQRLLGTELCRRLGIYRIPAGFTLSVVIPVYNEVRTIEQVIARVRAAEIPVEIVIVDDGSRDGTRDLLTRLSGGDGANADLRIVLHERNQGKGAALKTGFALATGDVVVVQDADMEYDPRDFRQLLQPIIEGEADVVYGSRFSHVEGPVRSYWHEFANRLITRLSNWRSGKNLTDVETCYKMIRRDVLAKVVPGLCEKRFGIEIELTFKLARLAGVRFYERPISYAGRTYAEGKKIGLRDGMRALWCILRY